MKDGNKWKKKYTSEKKMKKDKKKKKKENWNKVTEIIKYF